jgi:hypothetical protein
MVHGVESVIAIALGNHYGLPIGDHSWIKGYEHCYCSK